MIEEYTSREKELIALLMSQIRKGMISKSTTNRNVYCKLRRVYNELEDRYNNRVSSNG